MSMRHALMATTLVLAAGCAPGGEQGLESLAMRVDCAADPTASQELEIAAGHIGQISLSDGSKRTVISVYGRRFGLPNPVSYEAGETIKSVGQATLISGRVEDGEFTDPSVVTLACADSGAVAATARPVSNQQEIPRLLPN